MENITDSLFFNLTIFVNISSYRYPVFVFCFLLYGFIVSANLVIVLVISHEKALHESMYIFIAFLSVNALYGSAGFFPRFLMDILSDTHLISHSACFTQIYVIYTYAFGEVTILDVMSYDRYVAVCQPLHYRSKMTSKMVLRLAVFAWLCPAFYLSLCIYVTISLPLCGNKIHKVYCTNWNIVKLSCVTSVVTQIVSTAGAVIVTLVSFGCILYTYLRIVVLCWKSSLEFRRKVLQSCLPHIISVVIYSFTFFSDTVLDRYSPHQLSPFVAIIVSLESVVIPPALNPLLYGLKLPEIRKRIFKMMCFKTVTWKFSVRANKKLIV
ncbi:olfactory receptor 142-like [Mastacembelus armatus]|uniref:Olfactory receptor 142-like n=1 Tax=Mastacembelus armatus TaxID=205130 RepID=A0A3Q3KUL3_9TELE|nr:olfactory receptor 142-like [Mastacembelus armatus]